MHLILTHEQADFDAIAAVLAARLLDPEALAVLPRRLNRNARSFVNLYGDGLPFIEFHELPKRKISRIILVDTQSLIAVRGMEPGTKVHVIDHHPPDQRLDPSWTSLLAEVGATTTLLVEEMQEAGVEPGLLAATLLLLGIYEDTGSLSYAGTSARDVRACAWLLECGASLSVAAEFLSHPLSPDQRRVYDRLLEAAETHQIHGLSVVIACASAGGPVEEISTLAHRLRDLFDPAGLLVLVALDGNVQLVARSTTDSLDVAALAQHFGGGGHDRAAAALIRGRDIADIRSELLQLLPGFIQPARTVGEIMSRTPQLLDPHTSVAEAAERMQRFGHEGYPVVEGGRVVGLLTRRAVDRAMAHSMEEQPVSRVMQVGSIVVAPQDSVQHLHRVMIQNDWGQVPVVDRDSGSIVGIVTRTDLLNTLATGPRAAGVPNLSSRLEELLPPTRFELLRIVGRQAERQNVAVYIVGGFVRDILLDTPSIDFDLVVEGDAIGLARSLAETYGGRTSSHHRFGTAKWRLDRRQPRLVEAFGGIEFSSEDLPASLDLVSARTEFYTHPTALPSVERGSIKLDLHRRDFTINTLALRLDGRFFGQLLDHWGGGRDLRQGQIRVLHSLSFVDDPTRMLRAIRLEQRLGFKIEPRTLELLQEALPLLDRVSGERIRSELLLIFHEANLSRIMARLDGLGLLRAIHPALTWDRWLGSRFRQAVRFRPPKAWRLEGPIELETLLYCLWLSRPSEAEARAVCDRLHLSVGMRSMILECSALGRVLAEWRAEGKPSELVARLDGSHEPALAATWIALSGKQPARTALENYLANWRHITPRTDGQTLRALGLPPGPAYREILWDLRAAWLDGGVQTAEEETALLERRVKDALEHG